jgi:uncharacterized protein (TIGR02722 family)
MNVKFALSAIALSVGLAGCAAPVETHYVDTKTDNVAVMGLDYKDFESAANEMLNSMLNSPQLVDPAALPNARLVVTVSDIENDTSQRIDTDQLTKKIRIGLLNSGRFAMSTAIGLHGPEDAMTAKSRELSRSKLVNQRTVKKEGRVFAPDYSLSGKIIQSNNRVNSGEQEVDYNFMLTLTNLDNGLALWEGEKDIIKRGDNRTVSW